MGVTIRQATTADAAALSELAAATFPLACPPGSTEADIAAFIAEHLSAGAFSGYLVDPARAVFVAEDAGAPQPLLAYTMLVDAPTKDPDVAAVLGTPAAIELSKCYARPDCHGRGVSTMLMDASLQWALGKGAPEVWLGVNDENLRARSFYEKHGFSVAGTKSFTLGNRVEHDYVMVRPSS
ncbi:hypothetical protein AL755_18830 [Arthrobacter sp. ERGS1:01]|uniref:GNAT family N-acetyltransferase n=1 Tax=Arthrobacter sp. ERGS1:01 TaxID=1704044 RepID=UPI0006B609B4|nr:GNAT family N-acetyltransferase [Arthrobacter sp. ERGS1:01]ALE07997.1 hypothetical protein AL755_18830 [Arthrobacter sp. ERGS1:01]